MKFGPVPVAKAQGAMLAHTVGGLKKGRQLSANDIATLKAMGLSQVIVASLERGDFSENAAALKIARASAGLNTEVRKAFTGRTNLRARKAGVVVVNERLLDRVNSVHESITIASLRSHDAVGKGQMLATVKVIPYAVRANVLNKVLSLLKGKDLLHVACFTPKRAGLVVTKTAAMKPQLVAKSRSAIADRLERAGSILDQVTVCDHDTVAVTVAIKELGAKSLSPILVFGASAIVDREDVVPAALTAAGGKVIHLGMPVDPGNLLMLGRLGQVPVIGVPTCARSLKVNGFDWVLNRICADLKVSARDVMAMGAGGLLAEISSRPQPRDPEK